MGNVAKPNIVWRGAHPNNFMVGRPGAGRDGRNTFHHVVGSAESAVLVFNNASRGASSHLVITDRPDVAAWQCVDFANTAYCDGNWDSNLRTISMEHHGDWRNGYRNEQVIENSARVVAWLRDQGLVNRPIRHRDVSNIATACPSDLVVEEIWNRATAIINAANAPVDTRPQWLKDRVAEDGTLYARKEGIFLYNLNNLQRFDNRSWTVNQTFDIGSSTVINGVRYYITKSSTTTNNPAGLREDELSTVPYSPPVVQPPQPPSAPEWATSALVDDANRTLYVLRATPLIDLENGRPYLKDGKDTWFQAGAIIENVSAHTIVGQELYQLTEFSFQKTKAGDWAGFGNGIRGSDLTTDPKACPPGTPANPTPAPEPEDPVEPMPDVPTPTDEQQNARLDSLEALYNAIVSKLKEWFPFLFKENK